MLTEEKLGHGYDPMKAAKAFQDEDELDIAICDVCGESAPCNSCPPCRAEEIAPSAWAEYFVNEGIRRANILRYIMDGGKYETEG